MKTEPGRAPNRMSDEVKHLFVYDGKVIRPNGLASIDVTAA